MSACHFPLKWDQLNFVIDFVWLFRKCIPAGLQFRNKYEITSKNVSEFTYRYALWVDRMEKNTFFQWWVATIRKAERYSDSQGRKAVCVWRGRHQIPWLFQWSRPCWTLSSSSKPQFIDSLIHSLQTVWIDSFCH